MAHPSHASTLPHKPRKIPAVMVAFPPGLSMASESVCFSAYKHKITKCPVAANGGTCSDWRPPQPYLWVPPAVHTWPRSSGCSWPMAGLLEPSGDSSSGHLWPKDPINQAETCWGPLWGVRVLLPDPPSSPFTLVTPALWSECLPLSTTLSFTGISLQKSPTS